MLRLREREIVRNVRIVLNLLKLGKIRDLLNDKVDFKSILSNTIFHSNFSAKYKNIKLF